MVRVEVDFDDAAHGVADQSSSARFALYEVIETLLDPTATDAVDVAQSENVGGKPALRVLTQKLFAEAVRAGRPVEFRDAVHLVRVEPPLDPQEAFVGRAGQSLPQWLGFLVNDLRERFDERGIHVEPRRIDEQAVRDDGRGEQFAVAVHKVSGPGGDLDFQFVLSESDCGQLVCLEHLQMHEAGGDQQPQAQHNAHDEPRAPSLAGVSRDGSHGAGASMRRSIGGRWKNSSGARCVSSCCSGGVGSLVCVSRLGSVDRRGARLRSTS